MLEAASLAAQNASHHDEAAYPSGGAADEKTGTHSRTLEFQTVSCVDRTGDLRERAHDDWQNQISQRRAARA